MRRVFLILIIVLVVLGLTGGVLWYLYRNTAEKLLQRSELALRAKQYDRAMELAESAAAKEPANWLAYFKQAQALCGKGQYNEARKLLEESAKHNPPGVTVPLAMADTYAMPARRSLASDEALRQTSVIQDAIAGLRQANDYLSRVTAKDNAGVLDVQQTVGLNLTQIGGAQQALRDRLEKEAQLAATAGDTAEKTARQKAAQEAGREADLSFKQATDTLAAVIKQDPGRAGAARTLVDLCVQRNDRKTLEAARQAIMSLEDPPPAAVVKLIRSEFRSVGEVAEEAKHLESLTRQLDRILEKHPEDNDAKLAKAEVAVRAGDLVRALELCTQVLNSKPAGEQKFGTSFLRARILVSQNKWSEAERELYSLKTEAPRWAAVQYFYGKAAHEMGKEEQAREAMRTVTEIERQFPKPDPAYAEAHRYLAESLLGSGFASEAFTEAKAYYEAVRSDPNEAAVQNLPLALRLYVQAANETKQVGLARTALNAALKDQASRPDVLLAIYEGYRQLGEKPEVARKMLEKAAECTPAANDVPGRLTVARATALLGRISEAERMLTDEARQNPKDARVPFELGRFFTVTVRPLQAIEQLRKAVSLDDRSLSYRESLAAALYESGLHDECLTECQAILNRTATNAMAVRLVNLIRLARGQDLLPQSGPGTPSGRALAQALLSNGRPQQCVDACLAQLKDTPNDAETMLLLGQAYRVLGQNDKCIAQWTAVLKQMPDRLPIYLQLAGIMSGTLKPDAVEKTLAALPGANQNMVDLAVGWLLDRRGQSDEAAETYGRLASRQGAPEDIRNLARIFRARSLAGAGHLDQATTELDQVAATSPGRAQALYDKAALLASTNRSNEADAILADMVRQAVKDKDPATLERVTSLYSRLKQTDKALAVCEQMDKVLPNDAGPCLMRADVLAAAGRLNETIAFYQQAIERQPGNLRSYTALARALDATAQPLEALATLKQLEGLGQTGRLEALLQQGSMFVRWGLQSQAVESFEQAAKLIHEADPQLQLALGQAFAVLGRKDRARAILGALPEYASQYITAQQILAGLEDTDDAGLAVLRQAQKVKPDSPTLFVQEMNILLRANRPDDVLKVFRELSAKRPPAAVMPDEALNPALKALLMTGDLAGAAGLTAQAAQSTGDPRWRQTAMLLALAQKPESAKALLPEISAAGPYEAMLGLLVASQTGQPVAPWMKRLDQIQQALSQMTPPQSVSPAHKTLVALVAGVRADAEAEVAAAKKTGAVARQAADEILASFKQNPKASEEAANLLKASLASELGMPLLGRAWAMQVLRARPTCQWAATIVMQSAPDVATWRQMLQILQPADCLLARTAQANLAVEEKQYDKSVELCQAALATDKTNAELVMNLAMALESAGRPADALPLYRQLWDASQSPVAGNNGAYIVSCLYPKDPAKLAEAQKWAEAAVKAAPGMPGFHDTLGWVAYLQGRNEEALQALRQAVRGFPASPEIHCHLGLAEAKANHVDLARWHLAATVNLVEKLKAGGATPAASALEAADQARQALAALERPKS